jgi:uncharacterized protein YdbL (DUF1318 family)
MVYRAMVLVAGLMLGAYTLAADLSQAKSAGWVCEQDNGYARVAKPNAPADVKAMVSSVNGKRKGEYQRIAQKNGVAVDQVARLTAQKVIGAAPQFRCK